MPLHPFTFDADILCLSSPIFIYCLQTVSIYPRLSIPIARAVHPFSACPLRMNRPGKAEMILASQHYSWSAILYLLGGQ